MAQAAKRISASTVQWQKLSERLTAHHAGELAKLKGQNSTFSAQVNQYGNELPKVDFAALKKRLPAHSATLDALQKQYESLSIPYGSVPEELSKEVDKWVKYNEVRNKLNSMKADDGALEAKKEEDKWAKAPPVEHFTSKQQFVDYFGGLYRFYDLRFQNRLPDYWCLGANEKEFVDEMVRRFGNYDVKTKLDRITRKTNLEWSTIGIALLGLICNGCEMTRLLEVK